MLLSQQVLAMIVELLDPVSYLKKKTRREKHDGHCSKMLCLFYNKRAKILLRNLQLSREG